MKTGTLQKQRRTNQHVPISCQEAQTGRADLVAEDVNVESCFLRILRYWAGFYLVDDPPLLHLFRDILSMQGQGYVIHLVT